MFLIFLFLARLFVATVIFEQGEPIERNDSKITKENLMQSMNHYNSVLTLFKFAISLEKNTETTNLLLEHIHTNSYWTPFVSELVDYTFLSYSSFVYGLEAKDQLKNLNLRFEYRDRFIVDPRGNFMVKLSRFYSFELRVTEIHAQKFNTFLAINESLIDFHVFISAYKYLEQNRAENYKQLLLEYFKGFVPMMLPELLESAKLRKLPDLSDFTHVPHVPFSVCAWIFEKMDGGLNALTFAAKQKDLTNDEKLFILNNASKLTGFKQFFFKNERLFEGLNLDSGIIRACECFYQRAFRVLKIRGSDFVDIFTLIRYPKSEIAEFLTDLKVSRNETLVEFSHTKDFKVIAGFSLINYLNGEDFDARLCQVTELDRLLSDECQNQEVFVPSDHIQKIIDGFYKSENELETDLKGCFDFKFCVEQFLNSKEINDQTLKLATRVANELVLEIFYEHAVRNQKIKFLSFILEQKFVTVRDSLHLRAISLSSIASKCDVLNSQKSAAFFMLLNDLKTEKEFIEMYEIFHSCRLFKDCLPGFSQLLGEIIQDRGWMKALTDYSQIIDISEYSFTDFDERAEFVISQKRLSRQGKEIEHFLTRLMKMGKYSVVNRVLCLNDHLFKCEISTRKFPVTCFAYLVESGKEIPDDLIQIVKTRQEMVVWYSKTPNPKLLDKLLQ